MTSEPANLNRSWKRLDGVDMLRGLAISFVLMNHVNMRLLGAKVPYTRGLPHQLVFSLVWNGQFGVQMFFVVSGFLITSTTLRRWEPLSSVSVRNFYLLRFARIAPLLLLLLAVFSALHFPHLKDFVVPATTGGLGRALLAAITFHVNLLEARRGYLPGSWDILWSLSVEETFYLFFPLVCRLFGRGKLLVALGRRSYEVYLTHMFVVFALFGLFVGIGKPMRGVPVLFIAIIVIAGMLGEAVARYFSDPMNQRLRRRFGDGSDKLGSVIEASISEQREDCLAV